MSSAKTTDTLIVRHGVVEAEISPVGAALVGLRVGGVSVIPAAPDDVATSSYIGSIIAPWPNRIDSGRYTYQGVDYQLECNEGERENALHGLASLVAWEVVSQHDTQVTLTTVVGDIPGYPWTVHLAAEYQVHSSGVSVTLTATNQSSTPAPYGAAFHPYLSIPGSERSQWTLHVAATRVIVPDSDRLLPVSEEDVSTVGMDFRTGGALDQPFLDHAFGGFGGPATATLTAPSGVSIRVDSSADSTWMQVHRPDSGPLVGSVVIEPQTCPPNAFVTGRDVIDLLPGHAHESTWRVVVDTEGDATS
jgi:aldose 1-epimerase